MPQADPNETQVYLPDFCAAGTLFIILLVAELVAIVLTLASHAPEGQFLLSLSKTSFFVLWLALLGTATGGALLISYVGGLAAALVQPWQRIGVRVAGSWTAAGAGIVLALALAGPQTTGLSP